MPKDKIFEQSSWWRQDDATERARYALDWAEHLSANNLQQQRAEEDEAIGLYEGELGGPGSSQDTGTSVTNCIQSAVDAFVADLTRQRVKVQYATVGGSWEERRKAESMSAVVETVIEEAGLYGSEGIDWCRDGFVRPVGGALKITPDHENRRVLIERIRPYKLLVDKREAETGKPRQLVFTDTVAPDVLAATFPEFEDEIFDLPADVELDVTELGEVSHRVRFFELWHLPAQNVDTSDDREWGLTDEEPTHNGRHTILCHSRDKSTPLVLVDEPWPLPIFPIIRFLPIRAMKGWAGDTIVRRLSGTQRQIDNMQARIDGMMHMYSRVILAVQEGVEPDKISNDWSRVLRVPKDQDARIAVQHLVPQTVPADLFRRLEQNIQWTREFSGKSEFSVTGQKPAGIETGVALRTVLDQDASRSSYLYRSFEEAHLQLARCIIEMLRILDKKDPNFEVFFGKDTELRKVKWSDIDIKNERFRLRPWPTNLFSSSPPARQEQLINLVDRQLLSPQAALRALSTDYPDVKALTGDQDSLARNIDTKLARIVEEKALVSEALPSKFNDLEYARMAGMAKLNEAEADGAPSDVIEALEAWLASIDEIAPPPPPPPPPMPPEMMPPEMMPPEGAVPPLPVPEPIAA